MLGKRKAAKTIALLLVPFMTLGLAVLAGCPKAEAAGQQKQKKEYIKIGIVAPLTGMVAGFGVGTPAVQQKAIDVINKKGGIYITKYGRKLPIKLITVDCESSSSKAAAAASKLILQNKVDLLMAEDTPIVVNPVSAVVERYKVPCIIVDAPIELWLSAGHYKWTFDACFRFPTMAQSYVNAWDKLRTNKKVGMLFDNQDGVIFHPIMLKAARAHGYTIVDPGMVPVGTRDFTLAIDQFKRAHCDIVVGMMNPPDFAVAWKQFHQLGYIPKVMTIAKGVLFPSDAVALGGNLADGLTCEVWWSPNYPFKSSLDGMTPKQLAAWWSKTTGKPPWPNMGFKYGAMEVLINALERTHSLNKYKLREAIATTNMNTMMGHIKFNKENYCDTPMVSGQWVKGTKWPYKEIIVANGTAPEIPVSKEKMIPIPGSK